MAVPHPRRKPLHAPRGAVATSQPLAAAAGLAVLRSGGNAVDAAVATAATLAVVQPGSNDLGGDLFAQVWDGTSLHGLNASGRSPAALTLDAALAAAGPPSAPLGGAQAATSSAFPTLGWLPVTVPGAPGGWRDLHDRFGALPFASLFDDAIHYARRGFPVSPTTAYHWERTIRRRGAMLDGPEFAEWVRVFAPGGRAPRAGETFARPDLARTLRLIAETGVSSFYLGETAAAVVSFASRTGGLLTTDDLASFRSEWVAPVPISYRDHEVWELPPNSQGIVASQALGILAGLPVSAGPDWLHAQIEAVKLGFADAHAYVAEGVPGAAFVDADYLAARRSLVGPSAGAPPPGSLPMGGTVYLCTADADGMMVSLIQSNYMGFGSHVMAPGTGFGLQNRGAGFSLVPGHPNVAAGSKRPFNTIIPGFLTRDGAPVGPFGVMGGHMQPQGHVQLVLATVDDGLDPQAALDRPRWHWHTGLSVDVEPELLDGSGLESLRARGHEIRVGTDPSHFGFGQAIWCSGDGGFVAGTEPRADGVALGY